jgi:pimeloyl-ACP methyl ester carboxylesterase
VADVAIHARETDARDDLPTVVLVHGLVVSSRYMAPLARALARVARVIAPDMPGFGRSENPGRVLDVPGLAAFLDGWLKSRDLSDVVLVANSFGCQYSVRALVEDASRVRSLVLLSPTMDPAQRTTLRQALRWVASYPFEPPSLSLVIARDLVDCGPLRAAVTYRHGLRHPIERDLPRVSVRTTVLRGQRDLLATQSWAEQATALLPKGRLVSVPAAGHALNYNSPEPIAELVRSLLEETR